MSISFTCPHCGHQTDVPDEYAGQTGPCTSCEKPITIPQQGEGGRCPQCGAPIDFGDRCGQCGAAFSTGQPAPSLGDDAALRLLLPVGRSPLAIVAGYAGLFSVLFFPAPIALLLSILAIRDIRRHSHRHGMGRAIFGVVMGTLFTLGLIFILISLMAGW